ncbi:hypothetical protein BXZ70DRAFT_1012459 [Cristinia sonorae]|uniref:BTB domain-containing protein n=1 Tax=Cristinia sonorae TaxID=1940300 RepID=A0A8K0XKC7_9AGAR|nr:hypothetical protein BXZ70DRAFT_1012459 [Cristinia sonorae]
MDSSGTPVRKRPRQDVVVKPDPDRDVEIVDYQNHPTLYFEDGNTILSCASTLFCVHRTIVSKHSPVLKILVESNARMLRGLKHIVMKETADDVEALLNVIYEGLRIDIPNITVESAPLISNVLRMCTKYKIDRPCAEILQHIKNEWPSDLKEHDAKMLARRLKESRHVAYISQNGVQVANPHFDPNAEAEEDLIIHPGSVIALLRECHYDSSELLAPLFYALTRGTWQFGGAAVGHHVAPLSHADIERVIVGVERLRMHHADFASQVPTLAMDHPAAAERVRCEGGVRLYWSNTLAPTLLKATKGVRQPIEDWLSMADQARTTGMLSVRQICPACAKLVVAEMERRREVLWNEMPRYFELEQ